MHILPVSHAAGETEVPKWKKRRRKPFGSGWRTPYRAQEKRWSRLSLVFGLSKLVLLVTFFLTVYFIGRAGASAWSGALAAAQAVLFAAACVVQHRLNVRMRFARAMAELAEKNGNRLTGGVAFLPRYGRGAGRAGA